MMRHADTLIMALFFGAMIAISATHIAPKAMANARITHEAGSRPPSTALWVNGFSKQGY